MWYVIVCDGERTEREQIMDDVRRCCLEKGIKSRTEGCADWPELAKLVKDEEPALVIVAQNGVEGLNTITNANLLTGKIIWFSDLDFGVQAYRLCVPYFCIKPVSCQKIKRALERYWEIRPEILNHEFNASSASLW